MAFGVANLGMKLEDQPQFCVFCNEYGMNATGLLCQGQIQKGDSLRLEATPTFVNYAHFYMWQGSESEARD